MAALMRIPSGGRRWAARLGTALVLLSAAVAVPAAAPEMHILVDVSGSMRQSDPSNLRIPALRVVSEILPDGARAGVWLFAERTEPLIPPAAVDEAWRKTARAKLDRVHSRGLHTDIEKAIAAATADWEGSAAEGERHLVLLTDGIVDVSKDAAESAASRQRILTEQLDRLRELGIRVHSIALSDAVDLKLLRLLSQRTDGWLETAKDAEALQRLFLHMLEQAAPPTTVPLSGNRFTIDSQVAELTLLAFREAGAETQLQSPSGGRITAKNLPKGGIWRAEPGYDLATIPNPEAGSWQLIGVEDPDNRVVVITDLDMELGTLPSALSLNAPLALSAWLTDHGRPVDRGDLLKLLDAKATLTAVAPDTRETAAGAGSHGDPAADAATEAHPDGHAAGGQSALEALIPAQPATSTAGTTADAHAGAAADAHAAGAAGSGATASEPPGRATLTLDTATNRFVGSLATLGLQPGAYQLQVVIDGGTFQRQLSKRLRIIGPPARLTLQQIPPVPPQQNAELVLTLEAEPNLIDPSSLVGHLAVQGPDGVSQLLAIDALPLEQHVLRLPITAPGSYEVSGHLVARDLVGQSLAFQPEPVTARFDFPAPAAADTTGTQHADAPAEPTSWLALALYLGGGNLVLAMLLGGTWWLLRRPLTPGTKGKAKPPTGAKKAPKKPAKGKR